MKAKKRLSEFGFSPHGGSKPKRGREPRDTNGTPIRPKISCTLFSCLHCKRMTANLGKICVRCLNDNFVPQ